MYRGYEFKLVVWKGAVARTSKFGAPGYDLFFLFWDGDCCSWELHFLGRMKRFSKPGNPSWGFEGKRCRGCIGHNMKAQADEAPCPTSPKG